MQRTTEFPHDCETLPGINGFDTYQPVRRLEDSRMLRFLLLAALAVVVVPRLAVAQAPGGRVRQALLDRFDANGDGRLDAEEISKLRDFVRRFRGEPKPAVEAQLDPETSQLYQPRPGSSEITVVETLKLRDEQRSKDLLLRVTYPKTGQQLPVIVYSHGALGSKDAYQPLIKYWASHGYVCIQPTHGDSLSLPENAAKALKTGGVKQLVSSPLVTTQWKARPQDVAFVIDSLAKIETEIPDLRGRLDRDAVGVGGHSYGAHTTMLVAGLEMRSLLRTEQVADPRPKCFLMISPQGTGGSVKAASYEKITRPALVITGDNDTSPRTGQGYAWRKEAYDHMPAGQKYFLSVKDAYHGFGGISGDKRFSGSGPAAPDQVLVVKSTALAFFDAHLRDRSDAREYLRAGKIAELSEGVAQFESELEPKEPGHTP